MDTIFALASARGKAGVSVVRLSGPIAHFAVAQLTGDLPKVRRASLRTLHWQGAVIDQALVLLFAEGKSFTGEQSAELHLHGSRAVIAKVIDVLGQQPNLRPAEAGEFTRRALENGRLDLAQVEGLADLIEAETEAQRKQALRVFSGALGAKVVVWRQKLIRAGALIEATIDFADEDVPVDVMPEVIEIIKELQKALLAELSGSAAAERVRDGFEVAILGAPNVGKSTLLNALAGRDAAITSEIAGTTRDVIEVRMDIGGFAVTLLDTAGLRDGADQIEKIGISRAIERANLADIRLFLLQHPDETFSVVPQPDDIQALGKGDLTDMTGSVSGKTGYGIDWLLGELLSRIERKAAPAGLLIRERQSNAMKSAVDYLDSALIRCRNGLVLPELVAADLRSATQKLDLLVGKVDTENLLDEIFASFCIGK